MDPQVRVHARGVVVGGDADHLAAAVARLPDEVRIGNARVRRVAEPQVDQVGVEIVVGGSVDIEDPPRHEDAERHVTRRGPAVELGGTQQIEKVHLARSRSAVIGVRRAAVVHHALRPVLRGHIEDRVGDRREGFVPRNPPPFPRTARPHPLERILQALRAVHELARADALLAAAGIEVGQRWAVRLHHRVLFLAPSDAVLDEDEERAR